MSVFKLKSEYQPAGDQPKAIEKLYKGIKEGKRFQTLLGVTGSGKTFAMANIIEKVGKPTLVIAHNKTLAAQLAQEYKTFFPDNAVHYFVSYYDYYQPEAYIPTSDTYIEKEAQINEEIERLRHASTQALLLRKDVIIVASVSCIYGLGSPEEYEKVNLRVSAGMNKDRATLIRDLIDIFYERNEIDMTPGTFRAMGNVVEIMPANEKIIYRAEINGSVIEKIYKIDPTTSVIVGDVSDVYIFPAKHFITTGEQQKRALESISTELQERLKYFNDRGMLLEADRIKRRTSYDLAMIREVGYVNGIENYSRHFSTRKAGDAPDTLLSYFPKKKDGSADFLTVIDESHVTIPQISGMYAGDASRKENLVEHGFRLPSAKDNRPLKFEEFKDRIGQAVFTSATPGEFEKNNSQEIVEQIIRPTGLLDPKVEIKPIVAVGDYSQIYDFIAEAEKEIKKGFRAIATTLTKKMAEDLSEFLKEKNIKAEYLHSEVDTLERIGILTDFRKGKFDVLVGVNLLREGLDLPEVSLIGILDADKEGFLRSETSLIQTIGRAARNVEGRVILYADRITGSMQRAIDETDRRRKLQLEYNEKHGITPTTIKKKIADITEQLRSGHDQAVATLLKIDSELFAKNPAKIIKEKIKQMEASVKILDFETAAILRDEIRELEKMAEGNAKKKKGKK
jgi:excinuclease ABC subunit B